MKWLSVLLFTIMIIACAKNQPTSTFPAKEKQEPTKSIQPKDQPSDSSAKTLSATQPEPELERKPSTPLSTLSSSASPTPLTSTTFPWLTNYDPQQSLINQIHLPEGYNRINIAENSIGTWIRQLP